MSDIDLSKINADPATMAELERVLAQVSQQPSRSNKGTNKDGLVAALNDALLTFTKGGKPKVVGRNEAFVRLFQDGFVYEDGTTADPGDLMECFAAFLETNPGVTVDRSKLEMSEVFGQWSLRVYNRTEVGILADAAKENQ